MYRTLLLCGALLAAVTAQAQAPSAAVVIQADTVLVQRGAAAVTYRDFKALLQGIPAADRRAVANDPERIATMLHELVKNRLLAIEARRAQLDDTDLMQARLRIMQERALAGEMLAHVAHQAEPADFAQIAQEYYLTNQDEFRVPERITVTHILIGTEQRSDAQAVARAQAVYALAMAGERSFASLVAEYSDDPAAEQNHGRYEAVTRGRFVPAFEAAAFALDEPGAISEPVKTQYGYHIIRLEGRQPERLKSFEGVKDRLIERMAEAHRARAQADYVDRLMDANPMQADPDVIAALRDRYRVD